MVAVAAFLLAVVLVGGAPAAQAGDAPPGAVVVSEGPPPIERGTLGSIRDTGLQDAVRDRDNSLFNAEGLTPLRTGPDAPSPGHVSLPAVQ